MPRSGCKNKVLCYTCLMPFPVAIDSFEGPLDLLLQLVEAEKLEITEISLIQVVEPFIQKLEERRGSIPTDELADFLVVAAKLVYLKSKAIIPSILDEELEEGPDLATQLRTYKAFAHLAQKINLRVIENRRSFNRQSRGQEKIQPGFRPPPELTKGQLHDLFDRFLRRLKPLVELPKAAIDRVVTIEEKMALLQEKIKHAVKVSFRSILKESQDKREMIVSFLALLELVKQRVIRVQQGTLFEEIELSAHESHV